MLNEYNANTIAHVLAYVFNNYLSNIRYNHNKNYHTKYIYIYIYILRCNKIKINLIVFTRYII